VIVVYLLLFWESKCGGGGDLKGGMLEGGGGGEGGGGQERARTRRQDLFFHSDFDEAGKFGKKRGEGEGGRGKMFCTFFSLSFRPRVKGGGGKEGDWGNGRGSRGEKKKGNKLDYLIISHGATSPPTGQEGLDRKKRGRKS